VQAGFWPEAKHWIYRIFVFVYVVVNFLSQVIFFIYILFLGMVLYGNEVETKEK